LFYFVFSLVFSLIFNIAKVPAPIFTHEKRKRFEKLAEKLGFDPLIPKGWYSVSLPTILSSEVLSLPLTLPVFYFSFFIGPGFIKWVRQQLREGSADDLS
jgi:hypothetical protein